MSTQVTVTLPDEVYQRAQRLAQLTGREIGDVLVDTIDISLPALGEPSGSERPISTLPDEEVLALSELQLPPMQDRRLSELLDLQQAGRLSDFDRSDLSALMQLYNQGLLRKAYALAEAVRRRLREPLTG